VPQVQSIGKGSEANGYQSLPNRSDQSSPQPSGIVEEDQPHADLRRVDPGRAQRGPGPGRRAGFQDQGARGRADQPAQPAGCAVPDPVGQAQTPALLDQGPVRRRLVRVRDDGRHAQERPQAPHPQDAAYDGLKNEVEQGCPRGIPAPCEIGCIIFGKDKGLYSTLYKP